MGWVRRRLCPNKRLFWLYMEQFIQNYLETASFKKQIKNAIQPIGKLIYNEIYVYIWFICIYNVFLLFLVLTNLFLLILYVKTKHPSLGVYSNE